MATDDGWEEITDPNTLATTLDKDSKDAVIISNLVNLQSQLTKKLQVFDGELAKLREERLNVNKLKNELADKIAESTQLSAQQRSWVQQAEKQADRLGEIRVEMTKELESARQTRIGLEEDRTKVNADSKKLERQMEEVKKTRSALEDNLDELVQLSENKSKSRSLLDKLSLLDRQATQTQNELDRLKSIREQQENQMQDVKVQSEAITSLQISTPKILNETSAFACKECGTHIGEEIDIESKCYQVGQGHFTEKKRGFLFTNAYNLTLGKAKTETFTTGSYQISWVSCMKCNNSIGWKYLSSDNTANNTKVGKFCLARYSLSAPEERR
jgi:DNA repair exonuclease SbcCD ATPase subunit